MIIFPPCPRKQDKIQPGFLSKMEAEGTWLAQRKFDGDRAVFHRTSDSKNQIYYGHSGQPFKNWKAPSFLLRELDSINLPAGQESFLDGELLKGTNTIILYDALQIGKYLIGVRQPKRLEMLAEVCGNPTHLANPGVALRVTEHVWLAQHWESDFVQHYREFIHLDLIEGLFLRKKNSGLDNFGHNPYQVTWQLRVRKPTKNYTF